MSKTYCTCQGMRAPRTARGGNNGVMTAAQSYDGSVIVRNWYDDEDKLHIEVGTAPDSSTYIGWSAPSFRGTIDEFNELLKLAADIKSGKASVVHHRNAGEPKHGHGHASC